MQNFNPLAPVISEEIDISKHPYILCLGLVACPGGIKLNNFYIVMFHKISSKSNYWLNKILLFIFLLCIKFWLCDKAREVWLIKTHFSTKVWIDWVLEKLWPSMWEENFVLKIFDLDPQFSSFISLNENRKMTKLDHQAMSLFGLQSLSVPGAMGKNPLNLKNINSATIWLWQFHFLK